VLLSGTPSDAPEPRDRDSRAVSCRLDSTRIARINLALHFQRRYFASPQGSKLAMPAEQM
jgi:hypothetical protein